MIAMKLGWAVLEGICVWLTLYYGSGGALTLAVLLLVLPLGSLPIHLFLRKRLRVRVEAPAVVRKGDEGSVTICLENPTLLPALRIRCRVTTRNQLNDERCTRNVMTWAFPKGQRCTSLRLGSEYCGRIQISVEQVKLYDCFGLIGVPCGCSAEAHMTVQPDTFPIRVNLIPNPDSQEDSDTYSQERPGADLTETFQIREYVPGDSMRQIHWKLSGKFDRLIVRDPALPITRNVLVFWERTGQSGSVKRIDAQAETVVSACRSLSDSGVQFTIGWNDTEEHRAAASGSGSEQSPRNRKPGCLLYGARGNETPHRGKKPLGQGIHRKNQLHQQIRPFGAACVRGMRHPVPKVYMEYQRETADCLALCQPAGLWKKILP